MGSDAPPDSERGSESPQRAARVSSLEYPSVPGGVAFVSSQGEGSGTILDISVTGAHVYRPTQILSTGTRVELFFLQPRTERKLRALAEVVRETYVGFAVRFLRVERELTTLILAATEPD